MKLTLPVLSFEINYTTYGLNVILEAHTVNILTPLVMEKVRF